ncbi:MAG: hypothetical protein N3D09_04745 [Archaeoglobaceae archaeon]|nr:hypothetical protein [Archaeoglobaceae archaeon]
MQDKDCTLYVQSYLKAKFPRSYLAATNHGAMGFRLPAGMTQNCSDTIPSLLLEMRIHDDTSRY